jgi:hypothetical protein
MRLRGPCCVGASDPACRTWKPALPGSGYALRNQAPSGSLQANYRQAMEQGPHLKVKYHIKNALQSRSPAHRPKATFKTG